MLNRTILLLVLSLLCLWSFGQVKLHGDVMHNGKALDEVTVQVFEAGKLQRTIAASKRGKYDMEFPVDHHYLLVFRRPYMIPVKINVNTIMDETQSEDVIYDVPLNMEMHYRFEGLDISIYKEPIGEVSPLGEGENTFSFRPDKERLAKLKEVNDLSLRWENEGREPIDADPEEVTSSKSQPGKASPNQASAAQQPASSTANEVRESAVVSDENAEHTLRMERQVDRYEQIEQAKQENATQARDMQIKSQEVKTNRDDARENYILESKKRHSEVLAEQCDEERELLDAKAEKQEQLISDIEYAARHKIMPPRKGDLHMTYGISQKKESGWFYTEEVLEVLERGEKRQYKHVTYNWVLFDADYYYMNDTEISQEMYEVAKDLFE